jgi:hypothetical protein
VIAPAPGRLRIALTARVDAATRWRRRWPGMGGFFTTVLVCILPTGSTYATPSRALLGLRLPGCTIQLQGLIDVLHSLAVL